MTRRGVTARRESREIVGYPDTAGAVQGRRQQGSSTRKDAERMSGFAQTMALHLPLPPAEGKVLQIIADECRDEELRCELAHVKLAQFAGWPDVKGCSPRTVTAMVASLRERRLIEIVPTDGKSNAYRLLMENWWPLLPQKTLKRFGAWARSVGLEAPATLAKSARASETLANGDNDPSKARGETLANGVGPTTGPSSVVQEVAGQGQLPEARARATLQGVKPETTEAYLDVRKSKRLKVTAEGLRLLDLALMEYARLGYSPQEIVEYCVREGIGGFKWALPHLKRHHPIEGLGQAEPKLARCLACGEDKDADNVRGYRCAECRVANRKIEQQVKP